MLVGSIIQVTGTALLSIIPNNTAIGPAVYGYEALAGLGVGMVVGMVIAIPPQLVESRDLGNEYLSHNPSYHPPLSIIIALENSLICFTRVFTSDFKWGINSISCSWWCHRPSHHLRRYEQFSHFPPQRFHRPCTAY